MSQSKKYSTEKVPLLTEMPDSGPTKERPHHLSNIKKVIGVISGKGGVGKSLVTALAAVYLQRIGRQVAVLDGDITGPSMPQYFGLHQQVISSQIGVMPAKTSTGIALMSVNLLLDDVKQPVVWRGPIVGNMVKQFWTDVIWEDIDYMLIDMPPGTGDVALTTFQSLPVDGIIVVTTPQDLVSMIVAKAVNMARKMNIPIVGIVENMSYFRCDQCAKKHQIFGSSDLNKVAREFDLPIVANIPIDPRLSALCDSGEIENYQSDWYNQFGATLVETVKGI